VIFDALISLTYDILRMQRKIPGICAYSPTGPSHAMQLRLVQIMLSGLAKQIAYHYTVD
jgi:hypothetical protein